MKYESTRGSKNYQTSTKAIIRGIAEDKGLYVPADIPSLPLSIEEMKGMTYQQIAKEVLHSFLKHTWLLILYGLRNCHPVIDWIFILIKKLSR